MYTGTLIEDLIAAVERVQAQAGNPEMRKVRAKTGVEDTDTEVVPIGSLDGDLDFTDSADRTTTALADAHMWAVPSGAAERFGYPDPLA